jgi:EAL domain-containing protein (putative c-di-GMP-specific phosphodiesterase class I)
MDAAERRALIADELVRSFDERRFTLAYQPIVHARNGVGVVAAAEALLRWECPGLGVISPGVFIPIAEERGLAVKLGEWVMRDACSQCRLWQTMGIARLRLHLNVTPSELRGAGFASLLVSVCAASGLSPSNIALEIPRMPKLLLDTAMHDAVNAVRALGVMVVADDVCDELSDRRWMKNAPIDAVKLNRAFVSSLPGDEVAFAFAERVVNDLHRRGAIVIGLGVETPAEWRAVAALECDEVQGFYFGSPMETNRFTSLLFETGCTLSVPALA